jgi:hypothetical protein
MNVLNMKKEELTAIEKEIVERWENDDDFDGMPLDLREKLERNGDAYDNWMLYRSQLDDML